MFSRVYTHIAISERTRGVGFVWPSARQNRLHESAQNCNMRENRTKWTNIHWILRFWGSESKHSLCIVMFGERSPNIMYSDVWWAFTKHHYTQWILWFWTSKSKDSLCIVVFGERSPNITVHDVWWAFTKHHYTQWILWFWTSKSKIGRASCRERV